MHGDPELQLLERQELLPLLNEKEIAAGSMSADARSVAAGKLLSVDLFAVLTEQSNHVGLVIFDGRNGLRLVDEQLADAGIELQAKQVADELHLATAKRRSQPHPICLLTVRNADLGSSMDSFCDGMGQILLRELIGSPDIAILERHYLNEVNTERSLPTTRAAMPLLPSLEFLELQISRDPQPGHYDAMVLISDSHDSPLAKVEASGGDVGQLMKALAVGISQKVGATAPRPADTKQESDRFRAESDFFRTHRQLASALAASEAAYALEPTNRENQHWLAKDLIESARQSGNFDVTLPQATRALDLCMGAVPAPGRPKFVFGSVFPDAEEAVGYYLDGNRAAQDDSSFAGTYESLRSRYRDLVIARVREWAASSPDAKSVEQAGNNFYLYVASGLNGTARTRGDFARDMDAVLGGLWLPAYEAASDIDWDRDGYGYNDLVTFVKPIFWGYRPLYASSFDGSLVPTYIREMQRYAAAAPSLYQKLSKSRDPVLQLVGKAGEDWCEMITSGCGVEEFDNKFRPVAEFAKALVANPATAAGTRTRLYIVWENAIELFLGKDGYVSDFSGSLKQAHDHELEVMQEFRKSRDELPRERINDRPTTMPWARADRVCDLHTAKGLEDIHHLIHPLVRDGWVWAIGLGSGKNGQEFMQLICLPLTEGPARRLARIDHDWGTSDGWNSLSRAAMSETCLWFATPDVGLLAFPLDGSAVFSVNTNKGLPSDHVDSIACCDGFVFAGVGDGGYIIRYDPITSRSDVLASSRRKDKRSPLDDQIAFEVPCMVADPPRHRVLCYAGPRFKAPAGIWQIGTNGPIKELHEIEFGSDTAWCGEPDAGHVIFANNGVTFDLDLRTDRATILRGHPDSIDTSKIDFRAQRIRGQLSHIPPFMYRDGYLWCGHDFTRQAINTDRVQDLPEVSSIVGHERLAPTEVLQSFDDGHHALMGDQWKLWMLTFDGAESPATRP
jgi:hypothetical protein